MSSPSLIDIVDDEEAVRLTLSKGLQRLGFKTRCFCNGQEFLTALTDHIPDCTLLDLRMPDIDGMDILEMVPRELRDFPIIFLTSHADVGIAVRAMQEGAFDFLEKPCSLHFLAEKISIAIDKAKSGKKIDAAFALKRAALARLPNADREVANLLNNGISPLKIGELLGRRPSEVDRSIKILQSAMGANSIADLVRSLRYTLAGDSLF